MTRAGFRSTKSTYKRFLAVCAPVVPFAAFDLRLIFFLLPSCALLNSTSSDNDLLFYPDSQVSFLGSTRLTIHRTGRLWDDITRDDLTIEDGLASLKRLTDRSAILALIIIRPVHRDSVRHLLGILAP
jgi:hypothetical protein